MSRPFYGYNALKVRKSARAIWVHTFTSDVSTGNDHEQIISRYETWAAGTTRCLKGNRMRLETGQRRTEDQSLRVTTKGTGTGGHFGQVSKFQTIKLRTLCAR